MKKFTKTLTIMLALLLIFSFGCTNAKDSNETELGPNGEIIYANYKEDHGIHEFYVAETEKKLVSNGSTEYKIVIPAEPQIYESTAMQELKYFFKDATGIELTSVTDAGLTYSENNKYLCIGNVSFLEQSGVTVTNDLGLSGFKLQTVGNSVYFVGGQYGPLYAVYEFLKWEFNYEYYGEDCWKIDKYVQDCELKNFTVKDVPDIMLRDILSGNSGISVENQMRLRETPGSVIMDTHHNAFTFIPKSTYLNESDEEHYHPEFYSVLDGEQLCYTARGNAESVKLMQDIVFDKLVSFLETDRVTPSIGFEQRDVNTWCNCESCTALYQQYGTDAASQILFINPVGERIKEWIAENQPGRDFTILLFAYQKTVNAPATTVNGEYVAINDIHCQENIGIFYAPIEVDFIKDFNAQVNAGPRENFTKWSKITDKLYFWSYSLAAANYFVPFNSYDSVQQIYKHAYESNAYYIYDQGEYTTTRASGFRYLRDYIHVKLMWNVDYNVNDLINDFFANFYGDYGDEMLAIFNSTRTWMKYIEEELGWGGAGCILSGLDRKEEWWPYGILDNWINMYDAILEDLEEIKETSPETYKTYYGRISLESASPKYLMAKRHKAKLSSERLNKLVDELCSVVEQMNITGIAETATSENLRESLLG